MEIMNTKKLIHIQHAFSQFFKRTTFGYAQIIFFAFTLFFSVPIYSQPTISQSQLPDIIEPEKKEELSNSSTEIIIRANVPDAAVYLNSGYQGRTPLTLRNYTQGVYKLVIEKQGYTKQQFLLSIERGKRKYYYIELENIQN